jgi:predicted MFS family arabinose efflux permease
MFNRLTGRKSKQKRIQYPRQFWLLFYGVFINRGSVSMMWPFLTVYVYQKLDAPLATITLLLTLRAIASMVSTTIVGSLMDRIGRKSIMVASLVGSAGVFLAMTQGDSLLAWAILMALHGLILPIFNIGVNAMVADIVETEHRAPAYALIRTISNAGIAVGPVIGGTLALIAFELIFVTTAVVYVILAVLVAIMLRETMPDDTELTSEEKRNSGYGVILRDKPFLAFAGAYLFLSMAYTQMFSLLPVYVSENFGLQENQYSLLLTLNAAMVVFLQYAVTRITVRYRPYTMIAFGAMFYAIGIFTVSMGSALPHFLISMGIMTMGELIVNPTATTLVADLAPTNMRARYMGIFTLAYPVSSGVGPVIGGMLNDNIAPVAIWYGATVMAIAGVGIFMFMARAQRRNTTPAIVGAD